MRSVEWPRNYFVRENDGNYFANGSDVKQKWTRLVENLQKI